MNILDKTIGIFAPQAALNRQVARKKLEILNSGYSNHGASKTKKSLLGWLSKGLSPDEDVVDNIETLRERSRDLYMGTPIATGALKTLRTNVIGAGLKLNASIDYDLLGMTPEEAEEWETNTEREFALWANNQNCDSNRTCTFGMLQRLAFLSMLMSGDSFVILLVKPRKGVTYDLRIKIIEADRVCNPTTVDATKNILGGVEIDSDGEPIKYHICKVHPKSTKAKTKEWAEVSVFGTKTGRRNVLHLFEPERPEQRRGVPLLAPVIETLKQLGRYTEAELMAAVISGMYSVFIKSETPETALGESAIPYEEQVDKQDEASYELGNGAIMALGPNESIEIANPSRPNTAFDGFIVSLCRQVGTALEIPFELLLKHFTASYSASRAALLEAWKMFKSQREFMAMNFCQPIYEEWLAEAVAKGRIEAQGFFNDPLIRQAWCGADWLGPSQGQIDPVKEANAAKTRVEEGFSTRAKEAAEISGVNYEKIIRTRIREEKQRRDGKLVLDNNGIPVTDNQGANANG